MVGGSQPISLYSARSFKIEGKIKTSSDMQSLKKFISSRPTLQEILKEALQIEGKPADGSRIYTKKCKALTIMNTLVAMYFFLSLKIL